MITPRRRALITPLSHAMLQQTGLLGVVEDWYAPLELLDDNTDGIAAAGGGAPCVLITEDRTVRRTATASGIAVSGFLGLVLEAKRRGLIASAEELITLARIHGFPLSNKAVHAALIMSGEIEAAQRLR